MRSSRTNKHASPPSHLGTRESKAQPKIYDEEIEEKIDVIEDKVEIPKTVIAKAPLEIEEEPAISQKKTTPWVTRGKSIISQNDMPPKMVDACQRISKLHGGAIFAFRDNSSLPLYSQPSIGKPHMILVEEDGKTLKKEILGKTSNQGFAAGLLPVAETKLGKVEKDGGIRVYAGKFDMPRDKNQKIALPTVQHKQSLSLIMENLKSRRYKMIGTPKKDGILRVIDTHNQPKGANPIIFSIDLKNLNAEENSREIKHEDVRPTAKEHFAVSSWWDSSRFGRWDKALNSIYPAEIEDSVLAKDNTTLIPAGNRQPLMVYALPPDEKSAPVPITGDQDLLWISMPTHLKLPTSAITPINAEDIRYNGSDEIVYNGTYHLVKGVLELGEFFGNLNRTDPTITINDIPNDMLSFGIVTPFEAYMAIMLNKELDISIPHARKLIQHGCECRSPYAASELQNINHVGWPQMDAKPFSCQTRSVEDLITFVKTKNGYGNSCLLDFHPDWYQHKTWEPLITQQAKLREQGGHARLPFGAEIEEHIVSKNNFGSR